MKGGKRNDGTRAFLASLALYVELRAYDNATAKGLFFSTLTHKPEGEADATNRGREGLEGNCRSKTASIGVEIVIDASIRGQDGTRKMSRHGGPWGVVKWGSRVAPVCVKVC